MMLNDHTIRYTKPAPSIFPTTRLWLGWKYSWKTFQVVSETGTPVDPMVFKRVLQAYQLWHSQPHMGRWTSIYRDCGQNGWFNDKVVPWKLSQELVVSIPQSGDRNTMKWWLQWFSASQWPRLIFLGLKQWLDGFLSNFFCHRGDESLWLPTNGMKK